MRKLALGALTILVLAGCQAAAAPVAAPTDEPVVTQGSAPPAAPADTPAPAAHMTLLALKGTGIKNSREFTATDAWTLAYSFDCSNFGQAGNFVITVEDHSGSMVDLPVNALALRGSDSSTEYRTGTLHVSINSECSWSVTAKQ